MRDDFTETTIDPATGLSDLVASRLCHDLINPLGAIGNGVELLEMTGKADGPEVELIRDAVRAAEARIRLFRLAFGGAKPGQTTSHREAREAVEGYFHQSRITVHWGAEGDQSRQGTKMAFLMLLCAEAALPMGGTLSVGPNSQGHWVLSAAGPRLKVDENVWSILRFGHCADNSAARAAHAQFPVLHHAAQAMGVSVNYVCDGERLDITVT